MSLVGVRDLQQTKVVELKAKVEACFKAAALATGCRVEFKWTMQYLDMHNSQLRSVPNQIRSCRIQLILAFSADMTLGSEYKRYMETEWKTEVPVSNESFASTDFVRPSSAFRSLFFMNVINEVQGDVTYELPALHPFFAIRVADGSSNHTP